MTIGGGSMRTGILLILFAAAAFFMSGSFATAGSLKGEELLEILSEQSSSKVHSIVEKTHAMGYLTGLLEALVMMNDINPEVKLFCLPDSGISAGEAKGLIIEWLESHPERRNQQARILVLYFLRDTFPCPVE
jgi:hypothetical protein